MVTDVVNAVGNTPAGCRLITAHTRQSKPESGLGEERLSRPGRAREQNFWRGKWSKGGNRLRVGWLQGEVPRGEKMLFSGPDPESDITEHTSIYEDQI